jgi:hypothetical protein
MSNKIIFFVLISIFTLSHSMMEQFIVKNNDVASTIFKWLYIENHFTIHKSGIKEYNHDKEQIVKLFGRDIQALTCTNKFFNNFYSDESRAQKIVKIIATHNKWLQDTCVTRCLNPKGGIFHAIEEKINNLFLIAAHPNKEFSEDDLKDPWYINATIMRDVHWIEDVAPKSVKEASYPMLRQMVATSKPYTLLSTAYKRKQIEKMQLLIKSGADLKNNINNVLLTSIATKRSISDCGQARVAYFTIAQLLLEHGANPDVYDSAQWPTPLMIAVYNDDQEYAYLLLKYKANPELTTHATSKQLQFPFFYDQGEILRNVFELEKGEPKGWLKDIVNDFAHKELQMG